MSNPASALGRPATTRPAGARAEPEDGRRQQLIETTIDTLAELGYVGTTFARIATRANISAALLVHYFGDKDRLFEAAFRALAARLSTAAATRLRAARTPRQRVQAVIDANLGPEEFTARTGAVWLAFWGQVVHAPRLRRVQSIYQRRMLSNLRHALRAVMPAEDAREVAGMTAALIDGVWLRAALSQWREADSAAARAMVASLVDSRLPQEAASVSSPIPLRPAERTRLVPNWIDGRPDSDGDARFETRNPATGEVLGEVVVAGAASVDRAVAAAQRAQAEWAATPGAARARILRRAADLLRARNDELARLETLDTGKPIQETLVVDVISGAECLEYFAGQAPSLAGEHVDLGPTAFGYTRREPLGVVAGIGAWNYPLQIACWKSAPALACGNAIIFKPAELTPLTAVELAAIYQEAGLPDGLFQVVHGAADTGRLLTRHPAIRKVSLTGEAGTGRAVMADAAGTLKHVTLELGGKSPIIVFDDAAIENAVSGALLGNFYSAGEVCSNGTRVFVHRAAKDAFLERLLARTARLRVGDPLNPETQIGALISPEHMAKVLGYIERGVAEGARLAIGGRRVTEDVHAGGSFVAPTIFDGCRDGMAIVREEIFGPVMSVLDFTDEDEAIARANATEYGLSAAVFTRDLARAHRVVAKLQAGTCWINHYNVTPIELPFGGVKLSGLGRENSRAALKHYTQLKSVYVALTDIEAPY
jgi:betaine-aldehyde dehydrogenase